MRIWTVCKDPGGTAGLLPVVDELTRRGHEVLLAANGKAVEVLSKVNRAFVDWSAAQAADIAKSENLPDVFVSTMCSKGGLGRDLVPHMRERGVPVVALQDFWVGAAGQKDAWFNPEYRPDYITTNDEVGRDLLTKVWPDFDPPRIVITGFPAFDKYAGIDFEAVRARAKQKLGLKYPGIPVVSFFGGGTHTHLALEMLCRAIQPIWHEGVDEDYITKYFFIPRPHPRTMNDFPDEGRRWQEVLTEPGQTIVIYDFFGQCDSTEIVAASDVICSISSTVLLDAAVMRRGAISIMPGPARERFREQMAGVIDQYPLVPLGCCLEAMSRDDLRDCLWRFIAKKAEAKLVLDNPLREAQEKHIQLDGKNASRVADLIESVKR